MVEPDRTQMQIKQRVRLACWIAKTTFTHPEYLILGFSTATMVTRTRINIMFICTLLLLCLLNFSITHNLNISARETLISDLQFFLHSLQVYSKSICKPSFIILVTNNARQRYWFRHCATNWKVAGQIHVGVIGVFH